MTKSERKRVSALMRATEFLFFENLALKLILDQREVKNWPLLLDRLLKDPELLAGVHLKFADLYQQFDSAANPESALEAFASRIPVKTVV